MIGAELIKEHDLEENGNRSIAMIKIDDKFYVVLLDRKAGHVYGTGADKKSFAGFNPIGIKYVALGLPLSDAESIFAKTVADYS